MLPAALEHRENALRERVQLIYLISCFLIKRRTPLVRRDKLGCRAEITCLWSILKEASADNLSGPACPKAITIFLPSLMKHCMSTWLSIRLTTQMLPFPNMYMIDLRATVYLQRIPKVGSQTDTWCHFYGTQARPKFTVMSSRKIMTSTFHFRG